MIVDVMRFGTLVALVSMPLVAQVPESRRANSAADKITFELVEPAAESRPADSRSQRPVAVIRITNKDAVPVTLWPFVTLQITDAKGEVQKPSSNRGRFGLRRQKCFLEAVEFVTVQPGKSVDWPVRLDLYTHDPGSILGWKLQQGKYTLTARYSFSRPEFISRCKTGCDGHAEPRRPWNAAVEIDRQASREITVK